MKVGKIPGHKLEDIILNKIGFRRKDVLVHAGIGEDSAVVDLEGDLLVISSDPITGTEKNCGYLAVHVSCNDLAATGAEPIGIQVILLLPESTEEGEVAELMEEITKTAASIGVEVLGGHTEILSIVKKPIVCVTAVGKARRDKFVSSAGALPGDDIIVTKGVGIEGTYILANDYPELLREKGVSEETIKNAVDYKQKLSVIEEGLLAAEFGAHAMHDITEGGLYGALDEISTAAGVGFELYYDKLPVRNETREITEALMIDPAGLISSGSMLIVSRDGDMLVSLLKKKNIEASIIGKINSNERSIIQNGYRKPFTWSNIDELWRMMEQFPFFS